MYRAPDETMAQLIAAGESYRCEFKSDFSSKGDGKEKICRTICAFANDLNGKEEFGVIALGVNDDGSPSGLSIDDELEQKVLSIRGEGKILPFPSFVTVRRLHLGQAILCIEVQPSISTPVKFDQRIWVRPGNVTHQANAEEERRLNEKRRNKDQPDDAQVLEGFHIHDLNLDYFKNQYVVQAFAPDVLQANGRTQEERLASTKMAGQGRDGVLYPTVLGMLCLGLFGQPYAVGYRNPNLAGALKDLGFVQRFGAGIGLARSELLSNGNPPLELDPSANYVSMTMRKRA